MKKLTNEEFIIKANIIHNNKYDYNKVNYINSRTKVCIICPEHGEFFQTPNCHLDGSGCKECSKRLQGPKKQSTKEFIKKLINIHGNKYDYSKVDYVNYNTNITILCPIHGEFNQLPYHHLNGSNCPLCSKSGNKYSTEQFIIRAKEVHGDTYIYNKVEYLNKDSIITITCKLHGDFKQKPHDHISGCGCPKCGSLYRKSQEKLFSKLKNDLITIDILWEYSPTWLSPQRFDIFIPKYNIAIEYNGEQHYIPVEKFGGELGFIKTLERDERKRDKCIKNDCKLFEVKYNYLNSDYEELILSIKQLIKVKENEVY